jgi:hypothetical protein
VKLSHHVARLEGHRASSRRPQSEIEADAAEFERPIAALVSPQQRTGEATEQAEPNDVPERNPE